ncbi:hypothetical protein ACT691_06770 [Vibrio metschnikovii]
MRHWRVAGRHAMRVGAFYGPGVVTLNENDVVGDITVNPDVRAVAISHQYSLC